jgi:hypothetical protein
LTAAPTPATRLVGGRPPRDASRLLLAMEGAA